MLTEAADLCGRDPRLASRTTVVVAMSGGVDSAVTAALLARAGHDVIGVTLQVWPEDASGGRSVGCCSLSAVEDARRAANRIGVPHYVLNFRERFGRSVIDHFVSEYSRGRTPNPCVECNRSVKFDELLRQAGVLGAGLLATGHYARIGHDADGRWRLRCALDGGKDQSYVLYMLTQEQLARTVMPLGDVASKRETRRIAEELGLAVADKPDSQEVCFVSREGYGPFLAQHAPGTLRPGRVVHVDGRDLGGHEGIAFYTVGQRRRLPATKGPPLYVVRIDPETDTVVVGADGDLYEREFVAANLNWIAAPALVGQLAVRTRIRYNAPASPGLIEPVREGAAARCRFREPQRAITPGQAAVFYQDDEVLGGGTIESVGP
ncbi:MAG TPA: tRNA 2-thiouridine(34) synthase MnmA [Chthonomonadales bacterium]|nr:tRNA 2-thiouridine(34) synthase MnmA [Chthonomonadales bacterium]